MIELIESRMDDIRALCERHRVRTLYLFGSATSSDFDPKRSDLDFLVEFLPDAPRTGLSGVYFALREDLADLFARSVDLLEVGALTNPYVAAMIDEAKVSLYAA